MGSALGSSICSERLWLKPCSFWSCRFWWFSLKRGKQPHRKAKARAKVTPTPGNEHAPLQIAILTMKLMMILVMTVTKVVVMNLLQSPLHEACYWQRSNFEETCQQQTPRKTWRGGHWFLCSSSKSSFYWLIVFKITTPIHPTCSELFLNSIGYRYLSIFQETLPKHFVKTSQALRVCYGEEGWTWAERGWIFVLSAAVFIFWFLHVFVCLLKWFVLQNGPPNSTGIENQIGLLSTGQNPIPFWRVLASPLAKICLTRATL